MPTFQRQAVLVEDGTGTVLGVGYTGAASTTNGIAVAVTDLGGAPMSSIPVDQFGVHSPFKTATENIVMLTFTKAGQPGSTSTMAVSVETLEAAASAGNAVTQTQALVAQAIAAKDAAVAAASQASSGSYPAPVRQAGDGSWPSRPTDQGNVLISWVGWTAPPVVASGTGGMHPGDIFMKVPAP